MKRILSFLFSLLLLSGCASSEDPSSKADREISSSKASSESKASVSFTDSTGAVIEVSPSPCAVSLYSSYAQAWLLAGGKLSGVTEDAVKERDLSLPEEAAIIGTVKDPNAEKIIALEPELALLSLDIASHKEIGSILESAGIPCAYFRVDTFEDYAFMMEQFCRITENKSCYEESVVKVKQQIEDIKEKTSASSDYPRVLLMRAFSTGIKAKTDDELAGAILKDLGCENIADDHPSMLEDLSLEEVILEDPEFIFVTTMGDEGKALEYLESTSGQNPAWAGLSAVKNDRYIILPKDLFHYKPNDKWGESYEYLAKILYPELFP